MAAVGTMGATEATGAGAETGAVELRGIMGCAPTIPGIATPPGKQGVHKYGQHSYLIILLSDNRINQAVVKYLYSVLLLLDGPSVITSCQLFFSCSLKRMIRIHITLQLHYSMALIKLQSSGTDLEPLVAWV